MDYYLSKFMDDLPDIYVSDYIVLLKKIGFIEGIFSGVEQLVIFFDDTKVVGYIIISPMGKMTTYKVSSKVNISRHKDRDTVMVTGISNYNSAYKVIRGYRKENKSKKIKKLIGSVTL